MPAEIRPVPSRPAGELKQSWSYEELVSQLGPQIRPGALLQRYTTAHVGGPATALWEVSTRDELAAACGSLWQKGIPFVVFGNGSNLLISDRGFDGVVVLNRTSIIVVNRDGDPPSVWAESGASLAAMAHQVAAQGLAGLEWAGAIPGTVGGAVYGNAGAYGGDVARSLLRANLLLRGGQREMWTVEHFSYAYRSSVLKRGTRQAVILDAEFRLQKANRDEVMCRLHEISEQRKATQPPGASLGSMFKNPPGDSAGRLIEQAGLKGTRIGGAEISPVHANFIVNDAQATASDIYRLLHLAQQTVAEKFHVWLEPEIEIIGDWSGEPPLTQPSAESFDEEGRA